VSAATSVLKATRRDELGKKVSHLRKAGQIPGVVFGHGMASIPVAIDAHEFDHVRRTAHSNTILELQLGGEEKHRVLVHGVQVDPRSRRLLHIDLFAIRSGEEVTVDIPLVATGDSFAVSRMGGTLLHTVTHVRVRAMPENLPEAIEFSIEPLVDFDASIHLRDLAIPAGITVLTDLDEVVAKAAAPHVTAEEVPAAEEAPEAAEEAAVEAPGAENAPEA
jgi:large subunit ribosomal protein L25